MAEYLKIHPDEAHELMVPSGFKQRLIRRFERYLSGSTPLSVQNSKLEEAQWDKAAFDALLPGSPMVVATPTCHPQPSWQEINRFICSNGIDTLSGEAMAPHYEYRDNGERVRILRYKDMESRLFPRFNPC